jgi:hypothetical protein
MEGGTVIDTSHPQHSFLTGVIPPPDSTPFNEETRTWLIAAYPRHDGFEIAPVAN